jgi:hypothetical protein
MNINIKVNVFSKIFLNWGHEGKKMICKWFTNLWHYKHNNFPCNGQRSLFLVFSVRLHVMYDYQVVPADWFLLPITRYTWLSEIQLKASVDYQQGYFLLLPSRLVPPLVCPELSVCLFLLIVLLYDSSYELICICELICISHIAVMSWFVFLNIAVI